MLQIHHRRNNAKRIIKSMDICANDILNTFHTKLLLEVWIF